MVASLVARPHLMLDPAARITTLAAFMGLRAFLLLACLLPALPSAAQQQAAPRREQANPARPPRPAQRPAPAAPAPQPTAQIPAVVEPGTGVNTGLPIPRYASLRSNDVNLRVGPGTIYPVEWIYRRRQLPVEIIGESESWRQIRDMDGTTGWLHAASLNGRRTFLVKANEVMLRRRAEPDATPVARLMPGVVGRIVSCPENRPWCEVRAGEYRGFVPRRGIWGVGAIEAVAD